MIILKREKIMMIAGAALVSAAAIVGGVIALNSSKKVAAMDVIDVQTTEAPATRTYRDGGTFVEDYEWPGEEMKKGDRVTDVNGETVVIQDRDQSSASTETIQRISENEESLLLITSENAQEVISQANGESIIELSDDAIVTIENDDEEVILLDETMGLPVLPDYDVEVVSSSCS